MGNPLSMTLRAKALGVTLTTASAPLSYRLRCLTLGVNIDA